jgi:hypothetical protein
LVGRLAEVALANVAGGGQVPVRWIRSDGRKYESVLAGYGTVPAMGDAILAELLEIEGILLDERLSDEDRSALHGAQQAHGPQTLADPLLDRALARIERGKAQFGDRLCYSSDVMLILELVARIMELKKKLKRERDDGKT